MKMKHKVICSVHLPGSSPIIISKCLIFATALRDTKLYSKGLWDTKKLSGVSSGFSWLFRGLSLLGVGVMMEVEESGISVRNIHPGE